MELKKMNIGKWPVLSAYDEENGIFTVFHDGPGGAIVSGRTIEEASEKFEEAMKFGDAVDKLFSFVRDKVEKIADDVLSSHPKEVEDYRRGRTALIGLFVGDAMKRTKGKFDPRIVTEVLKDKLK